MKKNKYYLAAGLIGLLITTAIVSSLASASEGDLKGPGPYYSPDRHEAMTKALESGDYQAWKELMGDRPVAEKIPEENFAKFVEMHNLIKEGKLEEAKAIGDELGIRKAYGHRGHPDMKRFSQKGYDQGYADGQASCLK